MKDQQVAMMTTEVEDKRVEEAQLKLKSDPLANESESIVLVSHLSKLLERKDWKKEQFGEVPTIVRALQRYFESMQELQRSKSFVEKVGSNEAKAIIESNRTRLKSYQSALRTFCRSEHCPAGVRVELIFAVLDSIKLEASKRFQVENLDFVLQLICCGDQLTELLLETLSTEYFRYVDVTYYGLKSLSQLCTKLKGNKSAVADVEDTICNVFDVMRCLTKSVRTFLSDEVPLEEAATLTRKGEGEGEKEEGEAVHVPKYLQEKMLKHTFTQAWLSFLRLPLPSHVLKRALTMLPEDIMKNMTTPVLLSDILTNCVDQKGLIGILALHGLFLLVVEHGLEYPNFYRKLYNMLTVSTFLTKYRAKFYRLVDTFLSTPLIPAYVVAAFIKRFARMAIQAPPHGALLAMAFIFNLIRRHPSCAMVLQGKSSSKDGQADPYNETEDDPAKARALESSLWELETLKSHYYHEVARFVSVFKRDMTKRNKYTEIDIEKFVSRSYDETYRRENAKRLKMCAVKFLDKERENLF